jgi:LPXTG-motif cell wall-anchored protein
MNASTPIALAIAAAAILIGAAILLLRKCRAH